MNLTEQHKTILRKIYESTNQCLSTKNFVDDNPVNLILKDLEDADLIEQEGNAYYLTEAGYDFFDKSKKKIKPQKNVFDDDVDRLMESVKEKYDLQTIKKYIWYAIIGFGILFSLYMSMAKK